MNKIGKLGLSGLVLLGSLQLGCAAVKPEIKNIEPKAEIKISQTDAGEFKPGDVYQSETIKPEYGWKVARKVAGFIDEKAYPKFDENGDAYIVAHSEVCATERLADERARHNADEKAIKNGLARKIGPNTYFLSGITQEESEVWMVTNEKGEFGYVEHAVFKIPGAQKPKSNVNTRKVGDCTIEERIDPNQYHLGLSCSGKGALGGKDLEAKECNLSNYGSLQDAREFCVEMIKEYIKPKLE